MKAFENSIVKFGGSSLADAAAMEEAAQIMEKDPRRRFAVVSAPGKGKHAAVKITDLLLAAAGGDFHAYQTVRERFLRMAAAFGAESRMEEALSLLPPPGSPLLAPLGRDYCVSRGEYFCALLFAWRLGWEICDAGEIIRFGEGGSFEEEATLHAIREKLRGKEKLVIPGFYGRKPDGCIRTFPRGGSDITGALLAAALGLRYENLTDVPGVLAADPRIVPDPPVVPTVTFGEMRQLSRYGAGVLQEDALLPAAKAGIPIRLGLNRDGGESGSDILPLAKNRRLPFYARSAKGGYTLLRVKRQDGFGNENGFLRKLTETTEDCGIPIEALCAYGERVDLLLPTPALMGLRRRLLHRLFRAVHPAHAEFTDEIALFTAAGCDEATILSALKKNGIPVYTSLFAGELPLFGIPSSCLQAALRIEILPSEANRTV